MIIKYDSCNVDRIAKKVVKILKKGGVAIIPTDTCYGLVADATNDEVVKRIFDIKRRPYDKPIAVFLPSKKDIYKYAEIDELGEKFLNLLPARLTLIFKAKAKLPEPMIIKNGKIGIRVVKHVLPTLITKVLGKPITATSANIHGQPPCYASSELMNINVDLIVDAGELPRVPVSTVIDVTTIPPTILREGAISAEEIEKRLQIKLRKMHKSM